MLTFAESGLREELLRAVADIGFVEPTPVQQQAIPQILTTDRDVIAFAQTGTGKTAAFGLPCLHRVDPNMRHTQAIVLCPTRELCLQITSDLNDFAKYLRGVQITAVYGGARIEGQIKALKKGSQIVVGTPGRTLDLIKRRKLDLSMVDFVVLDEADEMLSMGFKEDLEAILGQAPETRQTMLFSATMSDDMKGMTSQMHNPHRISVAAKNKGADTVRHILYTVHARDRYDALKRITDYHPNIYAIVFCRTRRETKEVANKLMHDGYNADAIHGDLSQAQRDEVMNKFRKRQLQMLVATDVAARGLDVSDLTHVINYNLPDEIQSYVHRSGRTGRAGKTGISVAIAHSREGRKIRDIQRSAGIKFEKAKVPTGREICQKQLFALIDKIENVEVDEAQIEPFLPTIYKKLQWLERDQLIKHFVSAEFNRFLSYYKGAKDLNVPERTERKERNERSSDRSGQQSRRSGNFTAYIVNIGTRNHVNPARLIGLINECVQSDRARIGKIDVQKKHSFFEIEKGWEVAILSTMNGKAFGSRQIQVEIIEGIPEQERSRPPRRNERPPKHKKKRHKKHKGGKSKFKGKGRKRS